MKYNPGDLINFRGIIWKVLLQAKIGWEGEETAEFYDVIDMNTGKLNAFTIDEIDNGKQAVYTDNQLTPEHILDVEPATLIRRKFNEHK